MDDFEEVEAGLRHALQHVRAPVGFTDRVMRSVAERGTAHQVAGQREERRTGFFMGAHRQVRWWTAAAAALALTVSGGGVLHLRHQQQMRQAAAMQAQVDLAMQLTSHALEGVQTGLSRSGAGRFTQFLNETKK